MNEKDFIFMKTLLVVIAVLLCISAIGRTFKPKGTQLANDNTAINTHRSSNKIEFVSGCSEDGKITKDVCGCAYDKLVALYGPDWGDNTTIVNRILSTGYTQTETDTIVPCAIGGSTI